MRLETAERKLENIGRHLQEHPADYDAVIALYKYRSKAIEGARRKRQIEKLRRIAECRRILYGEHSR